MLSRRERRCRSENLGRQTDQELKGGGGGVDQIDTRNTSFLDESQGKVELSRFFLLLSVLTFVVPEDI